MKQSRIVYNKRIISNYLIANYFIYMRILIKSQQRVFQFYKNRKISQKIFTQFESS